jgi:hypothetical protein
LPAFESAGETGAFFLKVADHEIESTTIMHRRNMHVDPPFATYPVDNYEVKIGNSAFSRHADFAWEMIRKPLHFVQRGRILLRCGSALRYRCPPWAFPP